MITLKFRTRRGMLAFAATVVLGAGVFLYFGIVAPNQRSAEVAAREKRVNEVRDLVKAATAKAEEARTACFAAIEGALRGALPGRLRDAPAAPLTLAGDARKVPFVSMKSASGLSMPAPQSVYAGGACVVPVPADVESYRSGRTADLDPEAVAASVRAYEGSAAALVPPPVFAMTDFACSREAGCVGVVAWVSTTEKKALGVLRVTRPMEHLGYEEDAAALAAEADAALSR